MAVGPKDQAGPALGAGSWGSGEKVLGRQPVRSLHVAVPRPCALTQEALGSDPEAAQHVEGGVGSPFPRAAVSRVWETGEGLSVKPLFLCLHHCHLGGLLT